MVAPQNPATARRVWQVGALCRAVADALDTRFNPVAVRGEISGFSRASSGHCYFTLKDATGQVRCAMFRRAASLVGFAPRDGDQVEVQGRLDVYDARGDLQLVVESMTRAGQGSQFEQFMRLKARLEAEGLFAAARKRPLPVMPRGIGLVTSRGAAALHDVATCLGRRLPHIPVVFAPAAVQGAQAPGELCRALEALYARARAGELDVIVLVRGGGSLEDLWAFNDEQLARVIVRSPVPVICGVGHESDFTIADFCADLRAPTPTAAAELVAQPREAWLAALSLLQERLGRSVRRRTDVLSQRLDTAAARLGRPSARMAGQRHALARQSHRLAAVVRGRLQALQKRLHEGVQDHARAVPSRLQAQDRRLEQAGLRLALLDPRLVLQRGYALLARGDGRVLVRAGDVEPGETLLAHLAQGRLDLRVMAVRAGQDIPPPN